MLAVLAAPAFAAEPAIPAAIKAPTGEKLVLKAHATGTQIYVCQQNTDRRMQWTLKAPDAELHDEKGAVIGKHFAGPSWKLNDGSGVNGKAVAKADAPDGKSIPWLLITALGNSGNGLLTRVTSIQRVNTQGGQPPKPETCDGSKYDTESKSPYSADYYFYAPGR
jgi:hypothetical protein